MEDLLALTINKALQNVTLGVCVVFFVERFKPLIKTLLKSFDASVESTVLTIFAMLAGILGNGVTYGFYQSVVLEGAMVGFLASGGYYLVDKRHKEAIKAKAAQKCLVCSKTPVKR